MNKPPKESTADSLRMEALFCDAALATRLFKFADYIDSLEDDLMTLALRLYGEDPHTFAPETAEVMDRMRPLCKALIEGVG